MGTEFTVWIYTTYFRKWLPKENVQNILHFQTNDSYIYVHTASMAGSAFGLTRLCLNIVESSLSQALDKE